MGADTSGRGSVGARPYQCWRREIATSELGHMCRIRRRTRPVQPKGGPPRYTRVGLLAKKKVWAISLFRSHPCFGCKNRRIFGWVAALVRSCRMPCTLGLFVVNCSVGWPRARSSTRLSGRFSIPRPSLAAYSFPRGQSRYPRHYEGDIHHSLYISPGLPSLALPPLRDMPRCLVPVLWLFFPLSCPRLGVGSSCLL